MMNVAQPSNIERAIVILVMRLSHNFSAHLARLALELTSLDCLLDKASCQFPLSEIWIGVIPNALCFGHCSSRPAILDLLEDALAVLLIPVTHIRSVLAFRTLAAMALPRPAH